MNIDAIRAYCLSKKDMEESSPFGPNALVYKIKGKIFLILNIAAIPLKITVKCEPGKAEELRENYDCITHGYHMNKKHWNTITVEDYLTHSEITEWIDDSYYLVKGKSNK